MVTMSEQKDSDKLYTGSVPDEQCRKVGHVPVSLVAKVPLIFGSKELTYKLCSAKKRDQYREFIESAGGTLSGNKRLVICNDGWGGAGNLLKLSLKTRPKEPYSDITDHSWFYFSGGTAWPSLLVSDACKANVPTISEKGKFQVKTFYDPDTFAVIGREIVSGYDTGSAINFSASFNSEGKMTYTVSGQFINATKTINNVNDARILFNTGWIELQPGVLFSNTCIGYVVGGAFIIG